MTVAFVLLVIYFMAQRQRVSNDLSRTRLSRLRMILLLPHHPLPSPVSKLSLFQSSCVSSVEFTDGREGDGVWEEPNLTTARNPVSLYLMHYSLLVAFNKYITEAFQLCLYAILCLSLVLVLPNNIGIFTKRSLVFCRLSKRNSCWFRIYPGCWVVGRTVSAAGCSDLNPSCIHCILFSFIERNVKGNRIEYNISKL